MWPSPCRGTDRSAQGVAGNALGGFRIRPPSSQSKFPSGGWDLALLLNENSGHEIDRNELKTSVYRWIGGAGEDA